MTPTGTRIFIIPAVESMAGRFHIHRMSTQMPDRGIIHAIAPKAKELLGVDVGDTIVFDRHHQQLSNDGKITMINADHVLAKLG